MVSGQEPRRNDGSLFRRDGNGCSEEQKRQEQRGGDPEEIRVWEQEEVERVWMSDEDEEHKDREEEEERKTERKESMLLSGS